MKYFIPIIVFLCVALNAQAGIEKPSPAGHGTYAELDEPNTFTEPQTFEGGIVAPSYTVVDPANLAGFIGLPIRYDVPPRAFGDALLGYAGVIGWYNVVDDTTGMFYYTPSTATKWAITTTAGTEVMTVPIDLYFRDSDACADYKSATCNDDEWGTNWVYNGVPNNLFSVEPSAAGDNILKITNPSALGINSFIKTITPDITDTTENRVESWVKFGSTSKYATTGYVGGQPLHCVGFTSEATSGSPQVDCIGVCATYYPSDAAVGLRGTYKGIAVVAGSDETARVYESDEESIDLTEKNFVQVVMTGTDFSVYINGTKIADQTTVANYLYTGTFGAGTLAIQSRADWLDATFSAGQFSFAQSYGAMAGTAIEIEFTTLMYLEKIAE